MIDLTASRRIGKTAVYERQASSGTRFGFGTPKLVLAVLAWPDVVRVLQRDATREAVLGRYKSAGFTPDDFGRKRPAREAMAGVLTCAEDHLELQAAGRPTRERDALRDVRRRLEWELST